MNFIRNLIQGSGKCESGNKKKGSDGVLESPIRTPTVSSELTDSTHDISHLQDQTSHEPNAACQSTVESDALSGSDEVSFVSCGTHIATSATSESLQDDHCNDDATQADSFASEGLELFNNNTDRNSLSNSVSNVTKNDVPKRDTEYESAEEAETEPGFVGKEEEKEEELKDREEFEIGITEVKESERKDKEIESGEEKESVYEVERSETVTDVNDISVALPQQTEEQQLSAIKQTLNEEENSLTVTSQQLTLKDSDKNCAVVSDQLLEPTLEIQEQKSCVTQSEADITKSEGCDTKNHIAEKQELLFNDKHEESCVIEQNSAKQDSSLQREESHLSEDQILSSDKQEETLNEVEADQNQKQSLTNQQERVQTQQEPFEQNPEDCATSAPCPSPPLRPSPPREDPEEIPIVSQKSYNLDYLDDPSFNPFATKTAIRNSPPPQGKSDLPPLKPFSKKKKGESTKEIASINEVKDTTVVRDCEDNKAIQKEKQEGNKPESESEVIFESGVNQVRETEKQKSEGNSEQVTEAECKSRSPTELKKAKRLEIEVEDISNEKKPGVKKDIREKSSSPAKKSGEKKPVTKSTTKRTPLRLKTRQKQPKDKSPSNSIASSVAQDKSDEQLLPKKEYNLDFLSNLDDPNFNPFASKSSIQSSPLLGRKSNNDVNKSVEHSSDKLDHFEHVKPTDSSGSSDLVQNNSSSSRKESDTKQNGSEKDYCDTADVDCVNSESDIAEELFKNNNSIKYSLAETQARGECCDLLDTKDNSANNSQISQTTVGHSSSFLLDKTVKPTEPVVSDNRFVQHQQVLDSPVAPNTSNFLHPPSTPNTPCNPPDHNKSLLTARDSIVSLYGSLDPSEFEQLLGTEASRLAEELLMQRSFGSGSLSQELSQEVSQFCADNKSIIETTTITMATARGGKHVALDENVNPIASSPASVPLRTARGNSGVDRQRRERTSRPLSGGEKSGRTGVKRDSDSVVDRVAPSQCDDSGVVSYHSNSTTSAAGSASHSEMNQSEAGPEIATGLTPSDLRCASQFFKEATDMENQIRRNIASLGSQSKLDGDEEVPSTASEETTTTNNYEKATPPRPPPHEERSAPEGTSSPAPHSVEDGENKVGNNTPEAYLSAKQMQDMLHQKEQLCATACSKQQELQEALTKEQKERKQQQKAIEEAVRSRDALLKLVEQYKGMLSSVVGKNERQGQDTTQKLKEAQQEKMQALEDLANVEAAFSDVHRKYERTKQIVESLKRNEDTLRAAVSDYESKLQRHQRKFGELQKHAELKVKEASAEIETIRRHSDQEMTKMSALLKKAEMKIISLQEALDRKTQENTQLTQLCDDLINKVGT